MGRIFKGDTILNLHNSKTAIKNRFVLSPVVGITPTLEFLYFFSYQHFDSLSQLLFKEPRIKTHPGEYLLDVAKHFHQ